MTFGELDNLRINQQVHLTMTDFELRCLRSDYINYQKIYDVYTGQHLYCSIAIDSIDEMMNFRFRTQTIPALLNI